MLRRRKERRKLSMTSLIDVIFLLLLFFMLSSTFSKFAELELSAASGGAVITSQTKPLFLQLGPNAIRLNGTDTVLDRLTDLLRDMPESNTPRPLLIALQGDVTSQRLTDLLVVLRGVPRVVPTVLGSQ
ncbi:biopolymer transporter ExbD [Roseovarius pelagicus]|uniref:Biopolymer transporter ExbD n=1 Tax=Roseovarius pelagicus TaxID=2980108 RepID=A0ABY6DB35_9RHOB|nr:biopolymer transporter ExbD [Roseovarius pelagicus]UXX82383.1 biopolymer transporter ExbD [Roseovarius pelagicus]